MFPLFLVLHEADYKTPSTPGVNVFRVLSPAQGRLQDTEQAWCQRFQCSKSCIGQITRHQAGLVAMFPMFLVLHEAYNKTLSRPVVNFPMF